MSSCLAKTILQGTATEEADRKRALEDNIKEWTLPVQLGQLKTGRSWKVICDASTTCKVMGYLEKNRTSVRITRTVLGNCKRHKNSHFTAQYLGSVIFASTKLNHKTCINTEQVLNKRCEDNIDSE